VTESQAYKGSEAGLITELWLAKMGFRWSQFDRQPTKQWTLWLGSCLYCANIPRMFTGTEDIGIELADAADGTWFCWLRSDSAHRYHRFIHTRHLTTEDEVVKLIEALTGIQWNPANHIYGSVLCQRCADASREQSKRLDQRLLKDAYPWTEHEKDESRDRPLIEHVDAAIKGGLAK
jgi:hypothetical protein